MTNIELNKGADHRLHLRVGSEYAVGANVTGIKSIGDDLVAVVTIPIKHVRLGSVGNVIPFVRPEAA